MQNVCINKAYGTRKYSKYDKGNIIGKSFFESADIKYIVPKGLLYPLVGAFRAVGTLIIARVMRVLLVVLCQPRIMAGVFYG